MSQPTDWENALKKEQWVLSFTQTPTENPKLTHTITIWVKSPNTACFDVSDALIFESEEMAVDYLLKNNLIYFVPDRYSVGKTESEVRDE